MTDRQVVRRVLESPQWFRRLSLYLEEGPETVEWQCFWLDLTGSWFNYLVAERRRHGWDLTSLALPNRDDRDGA